MGLRPTVFRLAQRFQLTGFVRNLLDGVVIEVQGSNANSNSFIEVLPGELSRLCRLDSFDVRSAEVIEDETQFKILSSLKDGPITALPLPDLATCDACWAECLDPNDRRYLYPFISCTQCGPRHSIITAAPYDRQNTSMKDFKLCEACMAEYDAPADRRFHAQSISCGDCGPSLQLTDKHEDNLCGREDLFSQARTLLEEGKILALKGLTGYQLIANAFNPAPIERLRVAKARARKPFALMAQDLARAQDLIDPDDNIDRFLRDPANPIVIARSQTETGLAQNVALDLNTLGIMLPTTPLHYLLFSDSMPVLVATSGNPPGEPLCRTEPQAYDQLGDIADAFLIHDREIIHALDDSVMRIVQEKKLILRSGRGLEPGAINSPRTTVPGVAFGGHLKNAVAVSQNQQIYTDSYIGDLESPAKLNKLNASVNCLTAQFCAKPERAFCDTHPDYASTYSAQAHPWPVTQVFHHRAHACGALLDCQISDEALVLAWDGSGLGEDGTLWGGEFFHFKPNKLIRVASFRPWRLPGGVQAFREPRRTALGLLYAMQLEPAKLARWRSQWGWTQSQYHNLQQMLHRRLQSPASSSVGRLFDAVASLLDLSHIQSFEGEAAMALESRCAQYRDRHLSYPVHWYQDESNAGLNRLDWQPMIEELMDDLQQCLLISDIACKFHNYLGAAATEMAVQQGVSQVVLSGGCFQNATLVETIAHRLSQVGIDTHWPQRIAINDQGLAVGQLASSIFDTM